MKWIVVPLGLAALGYFVLGPRIGGASSQETGTQVESPSNDQLARIPPSDQEGATQVRGSRGRGASAGPEIEVSAEPSTATEPKRKKRLARRVVRKPVVQPAPVVTDAGSDATVAPLPPDDPSAPEPKTGDDGG